MKILSWNAQGLKRVQVTQEIKILLRIHKSNIIFLLETMVNETNLLRILPSLGFDDFDYVLPNNHSGGIVVLWNNGAIHASTLAKDQRIIHTLVHDTALAQTIVISSIYAPAQLRQKDQFWTCLLEFNEAIDSPWCLIDDFNEIGALNEKRGGIISSGNKCTLLNHFLETINAETVPVDRLLFTWKRRAHTRLSMKD